MEFFQTIALLCQVASGTINHDVIKKEQLWCQQTYIHCVNTKAGTSTYEKLERCIMEKR